MCTLYLLLCILSTLCLVSTDMLIDTGALQDNYVSLKTAQWLQATQSAELGQSGVAHPKGGVVMTVCVV